MRKPPMVKGRLKNPTKKPARVVFEDTAEGRQPISEDVALRKLFVGTHKAVISTTAMLVVRVLEHKAKGRAARNFAFKGKPSMECSLS